MSLLARSASGCPAPQWSRNRGVYTKLVRRNFWTACWKVRCWIWHAAILQLKSGPRLAAHSFTMIVPTVFTGFEGDPHRNPTGSGGSAPAPARRLPSKWARRASHIIERCFVRLDRVSALSSCRLPAWPSHPTKRQRGADADRLVPRRTKSPQGRCPP